MFYNIHIPRFDCICGLDVVYCNRKGEFTMYKEIMKAIDELVKKRGESVLVEIYEFIKSLEN
jgi:hypothetical protein